MQLSWVGDASSTAVSSYVHMCNNVYTYVGSLSLYTPDRMKIHRALPPSLTAVKGPTDCMHKGESLGKRSLIEVNNKGQK